jgi:hypothetical protein
MCLALLPFHIEVVDRVVLPPLLAPCIDKRSTVPLDRELFHVEQVVPALLNHIFHCQGLRLNDGVGLLVLVETA